MRKPRLAIVLAGVMYVGMFACALLCAYWTYEATHASACGCKCKACGNCGNEMKTIDECLKEIAPAKDAAGVCEWLALKDSAEVGVMDNYYVQQKKVIPTEQLKKILDKKFYHEVGNVVNAGVYMPMCRINYHSVKGKDVAIVYSFANALYDIYEENAIIKEGMLFDCDELENLLESL